MGNNMGRAGSFEDLGSWSNVFQIKTKCGSQCMKRSR